MKFNPILKTHRIFWYFCPAKSIRKEYAGTRRGILSWLAIAAVVIWGTTFVSTKVLLTEGLSPAAIMFLRFLIAYAVLRTVCPRNERPVRFKDELMFAAAGITGGSMYFLTENMALQITLVSNVALLLTSSPDH